MKKVVDSQRGKKIPNLHVDRPDTLRDSRRRVDVPPTTLIKTTVRSPVELGGIERRDIGNKWWILLTKEVNRRGCKSTRYYKPRMVKDSVRRKDCEDNKRDLEGLVLYL